MTLLTDNRTNADFPVAFEKIMNDVALESLRYEGFSTDCEISVSIVTPEEIKEINRQFRGIEKETDVLSFPMLTFEEKEVFDKNEKGEIILGDIILSLEQAKEQAKEYGHSLEREIAFLTAHSMFHLLGYDHMSKEEESVMFAKQEAVLQLLGIKR